MSTPEDPRDKFTRPLDRPTMNLPVKAAPEPPKEEAPPAGGLARLLDAVAKMLAPKPAANPAPQAPAQPPSEPPVFVVLVAGMNGDNPDGGASNALFKLLDTKPALKVKPVPRPFLLDSLEDAAAVQATITNVRHAVAGENADLMVWGDVSKDGYRLRISGANLADEERPGSFGPTTRLELPLNLGEPQLHLLYAAILAAAEPSGEIQRAAIRRLLPQAAIPLEAIAAKPPVSLTMPQQRSTQLIHGHVCAACAMVVPPSQAGEWFQKAINAYRATEKRLNPRMDPPWEAALLRKQLAATLTMRAERSKERKQEYLEEAVQEWRNAAQGLSRTMMPLEWAATQTRLGVSLYRLDLLTGDSELLREALQVLQASLQVHSRIEAPQRWAEIMHTIAQVMEVYGDQMKSPEVLKRSIEACRAVLEVRTRERTPLGWASTSNTLGSALFLLDKHGGGGGHLHRAAEILEQALEVFKTYNAKGPAQVAARNLAHVHKLAEDRKARQVIDPDWVGRR